MGMVAAINAPSGGGDIDDVIHVSSEDEDADDEDDFFIGPDDSILAAVGKAATRKMGASQPAAAVHSHRRQKLGSAA